MQEKQNLINSSFLMKYASRKFFKTAGLLGVPLLSIIVILMAIIIVLGGNVQEPVEEDTSGSNVVQEAPEEDTGMLYIPDPPESPVETIPVYEILAQAPQGVVVLAVDGYEAGNAGATDRTLVFERDIVNLEIIVSGYTNDPSAVTAYIAALEEYNEEGSFVVNDLGRTAVDGTDLTMFKLAVEWRLPA